MPMKIDVLDEYDLMFLRTSGTIEDEDSLGAFETYATHPNARAGQNILNDMTGFLESRITYQERMALHNVMEPILTMGNKPRTYVMYAPSPTAQRLARKFVQFWEAVPSITVHVVSDEAEALRILNLPVDRIADLIRD